MKAITKIKWTILQLDIDCGNIVLDGEITEDNVEELYETHQDILQDSEYEFREGARVTNIKPESSRHYESKSVASKMVDGSYVGWTYWYGGGKHGEPEAIDWMSDAYNLDYTTETKVIEVYNFTKIKDEE